MYATAAIQTGSSSDDAAYVAAQAQLATWLARRDAIAGRIRTLLNDLARGGHATNTATINRLRSEANDLIDEVHAAVP
jgi:5,10-methenyltetrahydromethanopterin hydrogenase